MKFPKKVTFSFLFLIFSFLYAQNEDYIEYEEDIKDTVIIDGAKYARIVDEDFFDDLEYDDGMWSIAPGYGFGLIKGSAFSSIPSGVTVNILTPYGFSVGPLYYNISFGFGKFNAKYNKYSSDGIEVTIEDTSYAVTPTYIGVGGDINFSNTIYSEGHIGKVGSGIGFRGFLGYNTGSLGSALDNDLDIEIQIGSEFYISSQIVPNGPPSYFATFSLRGIYSFHSLFGS